MSPITKVVLHVWSDGTCSLLTVPFNWRPGQPLPQDVPDERYDTPSHAMSALAEAGRQQAPGSRLYVDPDKRGPIVPIDSLQDTPSSDGAA